MCALYKHYKPNGKTRGALLPCRPGQVIFKTYFPSIKVSREYAVLGFSEIDGWPIPWMRSIVHRRGNRRCHNCCHYNSLPQGQVLKPSSHFLNRLCFLEIFKVHGKIKQKVEIFPIYILPQAQPFLLSTSPIRTVHLPQLMNVD